VIDQSPEPSAATVPAEPSTLEVSSTVLFASAVPETAGVSSLMLSSVLELPESLPVSRSGVDGAAGADVSIVTVNADEAALVFPAASVAVAVRS